MLLADIYAAREQDTGLVSSKDVCDKINANGGHAIYLGDFDSITEYVKKNCKKNDLLITMGAGNVDSIGNTLLKKSLSTDLFGENYQTGLFIFS